MRIYNEEKDCIISDNDKALVQSQFMKAHKCNADMSGVLKCEEALEIMSVFFVLLSS